MRCKSLQAPFLVQLTKTGLCQSKTGILRHWTHFPTVKMPERRADRGSKLQELPDILRVTIDLGCLPVLFRFAILNSSYQLDFRVLCGLLYG
jgi:hypothetical protein